MSTYDFYDFNVSLPTAAAFEHGLLREHVPLPNIMVVVVALGVLAMATRLFSSRKSNTALLQHGATMVPIEPYWLPFFGHTPNMVINADRFLRRLRAKYSNGIFSLNFFGGRHHILFAPSLVHTFFAQDEKADTKEVGEHIGMEVFGFPKHDLKKLQVANPEFQSLLVHLVNEEDVTAMVNKTSKNARMSLPSLVTGKNSADEQAPWERASRVRTVTSNSTKPIVEADMFTLVRDFIARMSNSSIMGSDFLRNYPDFFSDIWTIDREFFKLMAGLPRWIPIPALRRARAARERIIARLITFENAMQRKIDGQDPGPEWQNLDDVGRLVKERMNVYRKYNFTFRSRAANEHSLNWAANANSNGLTFWMLVRIYKDPELLAKLREETRPYIRVRSRSTGSIETVQSESEFEAFDVEGLVEHCALLKSCYIECLRLHTASWSFKMVKEDFVLQGRKENQGWMLRKGDYCHAAHELHNTNPNYFSDPLAFQPDRHIRFDESKGYDIADLGSIRPYGGGISMCKGRHFALKEVMLFTAAIIAMWDVQPAEGGDWKMPSPRKTTAVHGTDDDCRVWISRRSIDE